jgi:ribonucleoside-diphosphate reductase beta chain
MSKEQLIPAASTSKITVGGDSGGDVLLIGGKGYDVRQPLPVRFPLIRKKFLNTRSNFWLPNEIGMGDDKSQWLGGKLTDSEAWMFKLNISYLTASDNLVPDNLVNAILPYISCNEMRQYLRWQIAEEANHIESYLYILESLGLDEKSQGKIFKLYEETPELLKKLNWNIDYSNALLEQKSRDPFNQSQPPITLILENLISYYIFEFLFFPLGFSQIFALARSGKLRQTAQQYSYIWRDETNHSSNSLWMIKRIKREHPNSWNDKMKETAKSIISYAVTLEDEYARASMPDGGINGLSISSYRKFIRFMANRAASALELEKMYTQDDHPLKWMSDYEMNHETNFFEGRVKEYQTGVILTWE